MPLSAADKRVLSHRASGLYERAHSAALVRPSPSPAPDALAFLDRWQRLYSPGDQPAFDARLAWDGLTRAAVTSCVSGGGVDEPQIASWVTWIDRMLAELPHSRAALAEEGPNALGDAEAPFAEVWDVVRRAGRRALDGRLPPRVVDRFEKTAWTSLERQLVAEVSAIADAALFDRFVEWAGPDRAASSSSRYRAFVARMLDADLPRFLLDLPVLARQLACVLHGWVESCAEIALRLNADGPAIADAFSGGVALGTVVNVRVGLSDPHAGRRRVVILDFSDGRSVVYKPRSVALEATFANIVHWINARLAVPLPAALAFDRGTHGWMDYVSPAPLDGQSHADRYYRQAGGLLCLTGLLGARDLHYDNVIATREGPTLVDLEMLFQPTRRSPLLALPDGDAGRPQPFGLASGLLSLVNLTPSGEAYDVGGLRGEPTGTLPVPRRAWTGVGTDALNTVDVATFETEGAHLPTSGGEVLRPETFAPSILAGFGETYRAVLAGREDLMAAAGPLSVVAGHPVRLIVRPTGQYAMLLALLTTPSYQRDALWSSVAVDALHQGYASEGRRPPFWDLAVAERDALAALDVPFFTVASDTRDAVLNGRTLAADYFAQSGLEAVRARLEGLSEARLAEETFVLGRALGESTRSRFSASFPDAGDDGGPRLLLSAGSWIGEQLVATAQRTDRGLIWKYAPSASEPSWSDLYLYGGALGPALFLAALASTVESDAARDWALEATRPVASLCDDLLSRPVSPGEALGGTSGLGSVVYGFTLLATCLGESEHVGRALAVAAAIESLADTATEVDVVDGLAGGLLALMALYESAHASAALGAAVRCGDRLLALEGRGPHPWPASDGRQLIGFAHGAAGLWTAFARLSAATGQERFAHAARRAEAVVLQAFDRETGHWPIAAADRRPLRQPMVGWCHGAPGVIVAACGVGAETSRWTSCLGHAISRLTLWDPTHADHLCCGQLSRVEALLCAGKHTAHPEATEAGRALAVRVVNRARAIGHIRLSGPGTDYRVFDPGFFQGLSGVGYQFLRAARPDRLPSVASFAPHLGRVSYCVLDSESPP